ncbi:hypothetical protein [Conexibacter woesei]|uniref:Integral membrane protein n=1 Tax=Conexibacter woesei (strain DSM 14684 / CCUG 47730 / CIP 108061 / JCM 11494 / NBRC 100937 / ID131577) TaxID=469383 RepID=D3FB00_CONWI|nr:hypothetical protein [Conexibacter woesei]ADB53192.1 hypothetical protein Cwoe_4779 [Conexibacter woesei DSM 14684]
MDPLFAGLYFDFDVSPDSPRGPALLVLVSFLLSFGFIRTSARLSRSARVTWWPGSVRTGSGVHIHHLVWGISLLLLSGFVGYATEFRAPWMHITAVTFGIGAGLTLDEFALWLHLEDVYWAREGRTSLDAVVLATVFATIVAMGIRPVGLGDAESVLATTGAVLVLVLLSGITFMKGRFILGIVALHVPFIGIYTAVRLATPDSPWARWRYRGEKLARSRKRFSPDRPFAQRRDRLLDLIGGAPTRE